MQFLSKQMFFCWAFVNVIVRMDGVRGGLLERRGRGRIINNHKFHRFIPFTTYDT